VVQRFLKTLNSNADIEQSLNENEEALMESNENDRETNASLQKVKKEDFQLRRPQWEVLANIVDRCFCFFFSLTTILIWIIITIYISVKQ